MTRLLYFATLLVILTSIVTGSLRCSDALKIQRLLKMHGTPFAHTPVWHKPQVQRTVHQAADARRSNLDNGGERFKEIIPDDVLWQMESYLSKDDLSSFARASKWILGASNWVLEDRYKLHYRLIDAVLEEQTVRQILSHIHIGRDGIILSEEVPGSGHCIVSFVGCGGSNGDVRQVELKLKSLIVSQLDRYSESVVSGLITLQYYELGISLEDHIDFVSKHFAIVMEESKHLFSKRQLGYFLHKMKINRAINKMVSALMGEYVRDTIHIAAVRDGILNPNNTIDKSIIRRYGWQDWDGFGQGTIWTRPLLDHDEYDSGDDVEDNAPVVQRIIKPFANYKNRATAAFISKFLDVAQQYHDDRVPQAKWIPQTIYDRLQMYSETEPEDW